VERPEARRNPHRRRRRQRHAHGQPESRPLSPAAFLADGATLVYELAGGGGLTAGRWSEQTGIFRIPAAGGVATRILADGANPHFGAASDRIFLEVGVEQKTRLVSVDLNGGNRRDHAVGDLITDYQVSPDGRDPGLYRENNNLFVTPFFGGARTARSFPARAANPGPG
jgi:hypothetical protein